MAGLGLDALVGQQDAQAERVGLELARSAATAIDGEHRRSIAVLDTIATSPTLDREALAEFRDLAGRSIEPGPEWAAISEKTRVAVREFLRVRASDTGPHVL